MMFGSNVNFNYYLCGNCGALQIENSPDNISKYYPDNYYTHTKTWSFEDKRSLKNTIRGKIAQMPLYNLFKSINKLNILNIIHYGKLRFHYKILDVGCGKGDLLYDLYKFGFSNLTGIDPFLNEEYHSSSISLYKSELNNIKDKFNLIIFNHSLEHMWEQKEALGKAKSLLYDNGMILIRIPIINFAYEKYKENWVQIDAPRHFFLHSEKSFKLLCEECGLVITKILYDSYEFQFIGSEQYKRNIPLNAQNSYYLNPDDSIFSEEEIKKFKQESKRLNKENKGDQASFFIKKGSL